MLKMLKSIKLFYLIILNIIFAISSGKLSAENGSQKMQNFPPKAPQKFQQLEKHGDVRQDPYYWLKERTNPEVIKHLENENKYILNIMKEYNKELK